MIDKGKILGVLLHVFDDGFVMGDVGMGDENQSVNAALEQICQLFSKPDEEDKMDLQAQGKEAEKLLEQVKLLESKPKPDERLRKELAKWLKSKFVQDRKIKIPWLEDMPWQELDNRTQENWLKLADEILTKVASHYQAKFDEGRLLTEDEIKEAGGYHSNPHSILEERLKAQDAKTASHYQNYVELDPNRPKIICLCGSSRFIESFAVLAWEFEKEGCITLGLHYLPPSYSQEFIPDHLAEHEGVAKRMDELHLKKIDLTDEVFVINVGGYIGESTRREIEYATQKGKVIKYLEPI